MNEVRAVDYRRHDGESVTPDTSAVLRVLGPDERASLIERLRRRTYRRGETLCHDGSEGDCAYLVERGRLDVQTTTVSGAVVTLRVAHPGELVGELALAGVPCQCAGRVYALESSVVHTLRRVDLDELRAQYPTIDRFLLAVLAERLARVSELAVEMLLPAEARVWRRLAGLAHASGGEPIRVSQDVLAHAAGTVRQTANRVLRTGERDGVLALGRGSIEILDHRAVRQRC